MSSSQDLEFRKRLLRQRSAVLRQSLAVQVSATLSPTLRAVARVQAAGQWLGQHPALVAGAATVLLVWRPRAVVSLAGRIWSLWQVWQRVKPVASLLMNKVGQAPATEEDKRCT
jgi:hypothetical protein